MNPLGIVISIVVVVLILMLIKYLISDPYTLTGVQDATVSTTSFRF